MKIAWSRIGGNVLVFFISLFVITAILEVGIRLLTDASTPLTIRDPYITRRMRPNMDQYLEGPGWKSHIWSNELGWMGNNFSSVKPDGVSRVLHIGDSFVEAIHVDTDKTFVSQLEKIIPGTEHLNLSIAGRGTFMELLTYRHYGKSYDPDVTVIWFNTSNDFRDNWLTRDAVTFEGIENIEIEEPRFGGVKAFLLQYFRLPRFIFDTGKSNPFFIRILMRTGLLSMEPEEGDAEIPLVYRTTLLETPERTEALQATEKLLAAMRREVNRGRLVLGIIPSMIEVSPDAAESLLKLYPALSGKTLDLEFTARELKRIAQGQGIPLFDLTPAFRDAYTQGQVLYLPKDGHLAQRGHDLVAERFATWLTREAHLGQ